MANTKEKAMNKPNTEETFFEQYNRYLVRFPFLMNGVQAAIIATCGCLASQSINGLKEYDWLEVRTMALINFAFMTPLLVIFMGYLNDNYSNIYAKLFIDQFLFSPFFNAGIIALRLFLLGSEVSSIPAEVIAVLPKAIMSAWMFWIPTRFLIMSYIAPDFHLLVGAMSGFVWNIIFSMILSGK